MIDIFYEGYVIKLKEHMSGNWLATVRDCQNITIACEWQPNREKAEAWAISIINQKNKLDNG